MKKTSRGRPLKYGRPARVVAVTLPEDVIAELRLIHTDLGRAIVTVVNATSKSRDGGVRRRVVDFAPIGRRRSLIVVDREVLTGVPGCDLIPISDEQAFLALDEGQGLPDLELAILDRLADGTVTAAQREALEALRFALRDCRRAPDLAIEPRSILVVEKASRSR